MSTMRSKTDSKGHSAAESVAARRSEERRSDWGPLGQGIRRAWPYSNEGGSDGCPKSIESPFWGWRCFWGAAPSVLAGI